MKLSKFYSVVLIIYFLIIMNFLTACQENSNANLSGIYIAYQNLIPDFKQNVLNYNLETRNSVNEIEFTATADESDQTIKINDEPIESGVSKIFQLAIGNNIIKVDVTSSDKSNKKTYTVNINRLNVAESGITIHVQKPASWNEVFMWFDQHQDGSWDTHTLGETPGDMEEYRTGWVRKVFADTAAVEFIFNDGVTWDHKIGRHPDDFNFIATTDVWIVLEQEIQPGKWTGIMHTVDPGEN